MRKKIQMMSILVVAILAVALGAYLIIKKPFKAIAPVASLPVKNAYLIVKVTESGQPGLGKLMVGGDCNNNQLNSSQGVFSCKLESSGGKLRVSSLTYLSYLSDKSYSLPIHSSSSVDASSILINPNATLQLKADIDSNGQIALYLVGDKGYEKVDTSIGLASEQSGLTTVTDSLE